MHDFLDIPPPDEGIVAETGEPLAEGVAVATEDAIILALKEVYDPEIPVNVVELGLIYECEIQNGTEDGNHVYVKMTLTAAGCGMGPVITEDVKTKLEHVPNVDKVTVELTFDPPWNNDMLTDEAKLELGML